MMAILPLANAATVFALRAVEGWRESERLVSQDQDADTARIHDSLDPAEHGLLCGEIDGDELAGGQALVNERHWNKRDGSLGGSLLLR